MLSKTPAERPVYLFCHIPKCAGSTVKLHMIEHAPERSLKSRRRHGFMRDITGDYTDIERTQIDPETIDFVGGHSLSQSVLKAFPGRPVRPIVLIRDPLSLAVSFYNHRNRVAARKQGRGPVSFETYLKSYPKNSMIRFFLARYLGVGYPRVLGLDTRHRFDLVEKAFSDFWFVGSWRHAETLVQRMSEEMGICGDVTRQNAAHGDRLLVDDVPQAIVDRFRESQAADQLLFDRWGDAQWSGRPADIVRDLPRHDQASYVVNEVSRQIMGRYIKTIRKRL
jgi:hypothetical protein